MKNFARLDVDAVFHSVTETSLSVGSLSEHLAITPSAAESFTTSSGTAAKAIVGPTSVSTIVLKNTGKAPLLLASSLKSIQDRVDEISVRLGQLAFIEGVTATQSTVVVSAVELTTLSGKASAISKDLNSAHAISVPAGRVAVIPTTATITVAAPSGTGSYSCVWLG